MKLGINVTKETLTALAIIVAVVDDSLEDGKLKVAEGFKIVLKATPLLKLIKTLKELKAELQDLDQAEKSEITEHFEKVFDLRNDKAEQIVEGVLNFAFEMLNNLDLFRALKEDPTAPKAVTK